MLQGESAGVGQPALHHYCRTRLDKNDLIAGRAPADNMNMGSDQDLLIEKNDFLDALASLDVTLVCLYVCLCHI